MFAKDRAVASGSLSGALAALTLATGGCRTEPPAREPLTVDPPSARAEPNPGSADLGIPVPWADNAPVDGKDRASVNGAPPPAVQDTPAPPPSGSAPRHGEQGQTGAPPQTRGPVPTAEKPAPSVATPVDGAKEDAAPSTLEWLRTVAFVVLTVSAAFATLGKRLFVEIKEYFADFNNWLEGRSLLNGSIDVYTFHRHPPRPDGSRSPIFMELDSISRVNMKELLEHRQAVKQFKRAVNMCGPDDPFPSLNYEKAATGLFWRLLSWRNGFMPSNDVFRKRVDRELREEYSAKFASEIKRKMGGYLDERDLHVMIPLVEVWSDAVVRQGALFGENHGTTKRAELSFVVMTKRDFEELFSDSARVEELKIDNRRYENKLRMLAEARRIDLNYQRSRSADILPDIGLPPEHPDYPARLAALTSFWPHIKVSEKNPKALRNGKASS